MNHKLLMQSDMLLWEPELGTESTPTKKKPRRSQKAAPGPEGGSPGKKRGGKLTEEQKVKRMLNRFNGMSEEEVCRRGLPDYLKEGLDIVFIGINPSLAAAYSGKYYDGPGNHFWQALHLAGELGEQPRGYFISQLVAWMTTPFIPRKN